MFQLITDSTSDLTKEEWTRDGVEVVPLNVEFAGKHFQDRLTLAPDDFYGLLAESEELPKT
ncbi:DegV family protein, partial [uncultured Dubosiella sp.]